MIKFLWFMNQLKVINREFGNLLQIKDNFAKYVVFLDDLNILLMRVKCICIPGNWMKFYKSLNQSNCQIKASYQSQISQFL